MLPCLRLLTSLACLPAAGLLAYSGQAHAEQDLPARYTNELGMSFVLIPAGSFIMGSTVSEPGRPAEKGISPDHFAPWDPESQHWVILTRPYYLQTTEVTQGQWASLMRDYRVYFAGESHAGASVSDLWRYQLRTQSPDSVGYGSLKLPSEGASYPMYYVSWQNAQDFVQRLHSRDGLRYRLPTEAEWERAARAGSQTAYWFGNDPERLGKFDNYDDAGEKDGYFYHAPVASFAPNPWGLHDLHGNVGEICQNQDYAYPQSLELAPVKDPPSSTEPFSIHHAWRGGTYASGPAAARSASRGLLSEAASPWIGFRVLLEADSVATKLGSPH